MNETELAYKMFLSFIKNTESMVKAMSGQNFEDNTSVQIGMLDEMIHALQALKNDLSKSLKKFKQKRSVN